MKRFKFVALILAFASMFMLVGCNSKEDGKNFPKWVKENGIWRTVASGAFKTGTENAPTDDDLKVIMKHASLTPTSTGRTDYFLLVVKDVAMQQKLLGTSAANDGTVSIFVFGDRIMEKPDVEGYKQAPDRGYYNVGIVSGYINNAAIALGYGTHYYMTVQPDYRPVGMVEDELLKDKGYKYQMGYGYESLSYVDENGMADAYGNVQFVCAIVIGKTDADVSTNVTDHGYPENWTEAK